MVLRFSLSEIVALCFAALLTGVLVVRVFPRWRHARAMGRARRIAARLRAPATTLAAVEDQAAAIDELCQFPDAAAAVEAARELLSAMEATVRSAAMEILRRTRALDMWTRDLQKGDYRAKIQAVEALGEVADERAIDALIQALGDDDPDVARAASQAIIARDPDYAADRLADALTYPDRRIAETAAATLVRLGENAGESLVGELASLSSQARRLAVEALGAVGDVSFSPALLPMLDSDPSPAVRAAVAEALCRVGYEGADERLQRVAESDPDWFVRARALSLLAETGAPGAAGFLFAVLARTREEATRCEDESEDVEAIMEGLPRVRSAAVAGLRMLGVSEEEIKAVLRLVPLAGQALAGQALAGQALGGQAEPVSAEALAEDDPLPARGEQPQDDWVAAAANLRSRDPVQRAEAARQLAEVGGPALRQLRAALKDPEPMVRAEAARALGRAGDAGCLQALAACLQDPDADVRLAASNAMRGVVMRDAASQLSGGESEGRSS